MYLDRLGLSAECCQAVGRAMGTPLSFDGTQWSEPMRVDPGPVPGSASSVSCSLRSSAWRSPPPATRISTTRGTGLLRRSEYGMGATSFPAQTRASAGPSIPLVIYCTAPGDHQGSQARQLQEHDQRTIDTGSLLASAHRLRSQHEHSLISKPSMSESPPARGLRSGRTD